tara:strand:+ start:3758 stop:4135 length:378 start_codon:yes stop_codon:yes gene_type:complete
MSILYLLIVFMFLISIAYSAVLMYALANSKDAGGYYAFVESTAFRRMDLTKTVAQEFSVYYFIIFSLIAGLIDETTYSLKALEWVALNSLLFHVVSVFATGVRAPFHSSLAIHAALLMCVLRLFV